MRLNTVLLITAAVFAASTASAQVSVTGNGTTPVLLGVFGPGTYQVTATGFVSLTGQPGFDVDADGIPLPGSVTDPNYQYFNPNGSFTADGSFGQAGSTVKIGALAGTYDPAGAAGSYFNLGTSSRLTFTGSTSLYGVVDDTFHVNNTGAFSVSLARVPEPATWALMIIGFGAVGYSMRRRQVGFGALRAA